MNGQRHDAAVPLDEVDLLLVRHARPLLRSGVPAARWSIDPEALLEVDVLARSLESVLPAVSDPSVAGTVVASHEPKAAATARELARLWGRSFSQASDLEEHHRGPMPIVDDVTWRATVSRLFTSPETLVFGEETASEALRRFAAGVDSVVGAARGRGERLTTIVSHGTVITLYLAAANQLDSIEFWSSLAMPEALLVRSTDRRLVGRVGADGELRRPGHPHHH
jgi:broad specificity phosphatase PhoE